LAEYEGECVVEDFPDAEWPSWAIIAAGERRRQTTAIDGVIIFFMRVLSRV
jgi:hypothetical protein